jgi:hypothetical protein
MNYQILLIKTPSFAKPGALHITLPVSAVVPHQQTVKGSGPIITI